MKGKSEKYPLIAGYISGIQTAPEIIERIEKAIAEIIRQVFDVGNSSDGKKGN